MQQKINASILVFKWDAITIRIVYHSC